MNGAAIDPDALRRALEYSVGWEGVRWHYRDETGRDATSGGLRIAARRLGLGSPAPARRGRPLGSVDGPNCRRARA
jgi:hypothetical protein